MIFFHPSKLLPQMLSQKIQRPNCRRGGRRWTGLTQDILKVHPPPRMPVANEGLYGFPTENGIILVVMGGSSKIYLKSNVGVYVFHPCPHVNFLRE